MRDTPEITAARQAYHEAGSRLDQRTGERATAKQALADAQARMDLADQLWQEAASATDHAFDVLRQVVEAARSAS